MIGWAIGQPGHSERAEQAGAYQPDGQLVALARGGRPDAYAELVRRHQQAVYNIAYRLCGDQHEALDLAQETFVRVFRKLDLYDSARPFAPWICQVATNVALGWLQRRRLPTVALEPAPADDGAPGEATLPDYSAEPERLYLAHEQQAQIRQAILALPPHYRAVIELRHFQECSYDEIAATLAIPLSDVKSHLFRARRLLRAWLEEHA